MENNNKKRLYADLVLLLVAFLWGTTFAVSKHSLSFASPLYIIAFRFILATIIMSIIFHKKVRTINASHLKGGIIVGLVLFIAFVTQLIGLQYTTASKQAFLAGTYVVMAPFLYWAIIGKKPDVRSFIGAFVCFIGIYMLTVNTSFTVNIGDSLTLLSSLFFAGHIILNGHYAQKQDVTILTLIQFGVVGVLSLIFALILQPAPQSISFNGVMAIVYLGVFCTFIAYFLQTIAQKYTVSTHAAIILSLESVFGSVLSVLVLGDIFTGRMIFACIAIFISILIAELRG